MSRKDSAINTAKAEFFDAQVESFWAAPDYSPQELDKIHQALSHLPSLQGRRVIEPGCGTGRLTRILAERVGAGGKVLAMDISPKMIEAAKHRNQGMNNVELLCASLELAPLPRAGADLVFCHQVFPHFDDQTAALDIMASCLRPGGVLVIFHLISIQEINDLHRKAGTAVEQDLMPSTREMKQGIRQAGFRLERIEDASDRYFLVAARE